MTLLSARENFTALHLKGVDKPNSFFPPRLLLLRPSEKGLLLERGQLPCAKTIELAYKRTKSLGFEQTRMTEEDLASALETVSGQLGLLTEWDLRPARIESLMKACAEFMGQRADEETDDREMFGHLSLPAIEMICESWSRLLDPYWEQAKQEVRDSFAYEELPKGYIAIQTILEKLESDLPGADEVQEKMSKVIEEAELASRDHEPEIGRRVSVVFFSGGAGEH